MTNEDALDSMQPEAKRPKISAVWLDLLPVEVCSRIASMLPPWKLLKDSDVIVPDPFFHHDLDFMKLADVSSEQRRAVAASQQRVLRAERVNDFEHAEKLIRSWHQILENDIREVRLSTEIGYRPSEAIRKVLSLPSIVKASIPHCRTLLSALHAGRSVKQLRVEFTTHCLDPAEGDPDLADVLQSCAVEDVRLKCGICIDNHSHMSCYAACYLSCVSRLSRCESLRSLELQCVSQRLQTLSESPFVFPNLQKLRLEQWLDEPSGLENPEDMEAPFRLRISSADGKQLHSAPSVAIVNCGRVDYFAQILGERLTAITSREEISNAAVRKLERCPNLEAVDLLLSCGAETDFPTNLRSLRSISLSWIMDNNANQFYRPSSQFLLGLARRNENLEELRLQNMIIAYSLLEELLVCVGDRLRSLQIPVSMIREVAPIQTTWVMRMVLKHNPNIVDLIIGPGNLFESDRCESGCALHEPHGFFYPEYRAYCEDCATWKRADVFLEVLARRLPRISPGSINKLRWTLGLSERTKDCAMQ